MNHFSPKQFLSAVLIIFIQFFASTISNPCLNGGSPVFVSIDNSEFRCSCKTGFEGSFCEYQDTTKLPAKKDSEERQVGIDGTFLNVLLCVFFLLILPTLILYCIRTIYLFLKRCYYYQTPPRHVACLPHHRRNSTEIVVQLPPNLCRPLHGSRSMPVRPTNSLTLNEFHDFLLSVQRELGAQLESGGGHRRPIQDECVRSTRAGSRVEQPPPYESVARASSYEDSRSIW